MIELLRTNDWVRLSWAQAVLDEAGIVYALADQHASIIEGSIGAIQRRLLIDDADEHRARAALSRAEQAMNWRTRGDD
ncbi:MAG: DUF2007 domain-containing protein [Geminicoccaceae bacterium]